MEVDGSYPEEITSVRVNQVHGHDIFSLGKKRKFLAETKEQLSLQVYKYICCETLSEHNPFSKQAKVLYTHIKKEKATSQEVDEDTGEGSAQDSNSTAGESFSQCSDIKSDGCAKGNLYDESSSSSSQPEGVISRNVVHSVNSTMMNCAGPSNDEMQGDGILEDNVDEFGQCLGYLASACGNGSKPQTDEELEEFLYSNGMVPKSYALSSERLTTGEVSQRLAHKPTIDQEFEQYFSMLML